MAFPAMIVDMSPMRRTASIAMHATRVSVTSVSVIARLVTLHCDGVAYPNARCARSRFVRPACQRAVNAMKQCVSRAWKMEYVPLVKKKWRLMIKKNKSNRNSKSLEYERPRPPVLRFSPTAWAKCVFFCDCGETEISGFGISEPDNLLCVIDFQTIRQDATVASISLDDQAIADHFDSQVDVGRKPEQFFRLWLHTHPGCSAIPSSVDEETFARVFGQCDWAVMCVLAQQGKTYARLRFNVGPGGNVVIPVCVDYSLPFGQSDHENWDAEYKANIRIASLSRGLVLDDEILVDATEPDLDEYSLPWDVLEQLEEMAPEERQAVLDELAGRPDLWGEESGVMLYE